LDTEEKKKIDEILAKYKTKSDFAKVMELNHPKSLIVVAIISAAIMGTTQPTLGIVFSKVMNLLAVPIEYWELIEGPDYLMDEVDFWSLMVVVLAFVCLFCISVRGAAFSNLGQNVTMKIRTILY